MNRGAKDISDISKYINPSLSNLNSPFLFKDMKKMLLRLKLAKDNGELVCVWGDYDCDGICATIILYNTLMSCGINATYFIPDRHSDGYGLNKNGILMLKNKNVSLIVTVDCGITNTDEVDFARENGVDIIITDHHNPPSVLPSAYAILDAKVPDEPYPFKDMCGAGVALKISQVMTGNIARFIDIAAIATVADVVPLVGENRVIVASGLERLNLDRRIGISALCDTFWKEERRIQAETIAFNIAPMINACGRVGNVENAISLLTTSFKSVGESLASILVSYNEKRKQIENRIYNECVSYLGNTKRTSIALKNSKWDTGVIGIVASKLVEKYKCPVILLSIENGFYKGSARAPDGINLYERLSLCDDTIYKWGGHVSAAGVSVELGKIDDFIAKFSSIKQENEKEEKILYDSQIKVIHINKRLISIMNLIEPTGCENPKPLFLSKGVSIKNIYSIGDMGQHFKCQIFDETGVVDAIAFNKEPPSKYENLDIVFSVGINNYKGKEKLQIEIKGFIENKILPKSTIPADDVVQYGIRAKDLPLDILSDISDVKLRQFEKAGIKTIDDLVKYFPQKYYDFRYEKTVRDVRDGDTCRIKGHVRVVKQSGKMVYAMCRDKDDNSFMACWFNQDYILRMVSSGAIYNFCGNIKITTSGMVQVMPQFFDREPTQLSILKPIYKKIPGMSQQYLADTIKKAFQYVPMTDYLTKDIVDDFGLLSEYSCIKTLHFPENDLDVQRAEKRQVFDELFKFNFILKNNHNKIVKTTNFKIKTNKSWDLLKSILPYDLTNDQNKVISEMLKTVSSGNPINGLIQGDVGSGKTIVAIFMLALFAENKYQSVLIAPTEVLAKQHFEECQKLLSECGFNVVLITGSQKAKEKRTVLKSIKDGTANIIVGTHAAIQDAVEYKNLALVIVDEQHKFGVEQREKLLESENRPHFITMSATPIPRTLSMAIYGDDIQVYSIKEKPAGRKDIVTKMMYSDSEVNEFMLEEIRNGRQCYVVCPLIEESSSKRMDGVKSVKDEALAIEKYFKKDPIVKISAISGKMKQAEIAEEINKFVNKETNILISTTIIEVGVNVPNATVMVIKSSERFGLAQLHQLRGRVGRGDHQSYCILQTNFEDRKASILCCSNDGFEIAKRDLMLRGSGDFIGTKQTGENKSVMLMLSEPELYEKISKLNDEIFSKKEKFKRYEYLIEEKDCSD